MAVRKHSFPPAEISPARLAALEVLRRVEEEKSFASVLIAAKAEALGFADRALVYQLVMGVLRNISWLDALITHYAGRPAAKLDTAVRAVLRLGLYQLRFTTRIPAAAAVNESVNLVRQARLRSAAPFVNAVLRRATREPDYDPLTEVAEPVAKLALETSHPGWLIERWVNHIGWDEAGRLARANNEIPPITFRILNDQAMADVVTKSLESIGSELTPSSITPGAWRINGSNDMLRRFTEEGRIYVQDEASQLVAQVIDPQPADRVLDVCAAPGSKATHLADLAWKATVITGDVHLHRLRVLASSVKKQLLRNVRPVVLNAEFQLPFGDQAFDRVLVDVPCSGTGTLRRNPEIRWRISALDIEEFGKLQLRILVNAAATVKSGGRLVYSTCSLEPEENEQVIEKFREQTSDFHPVEINVKDELRTGLNTARTWPHRDDTDGFFIAAFQRD